MVPSLSSIVAIGVDILNAARDAVTSTVLFQTGDVITSQVESDRVESWQHAGFCSMPSNPIPGKSACQGIVWKRGDIDVCTNTRDTRGQEIAGTLAPGETCLYGSGADGNSQGRVLIKDNGGVTLFTTDDNTATGKAVALSVAPTGMKFTAPWGSFTFDATGFHLKTKAGPRIDMGGINIPGLPAALTGPLSSYITLTAGVIKNAAANVFNGAGSVFLPAVAAPALPIIPPGAGPMNATQLAALNTFALAVTSAFAALNPAAVPGGATAITGPAAAALALALAAAPPPVQSQTVWNAP